MFPYSYTSIQSPLDQVEVQTFVSLDAPILGDIHLSLTNSGLYLIIGAFTVLTLNILITSFNKVISNR